MPENGHSIGPAPKPDPSENQQLKGVESTAPKPPVKKPRGRPFPKGVSGNPAGRPKGALDRSKLLWEAAASLKIPGANGIKLTYWQAFLLRCLTDPNNRNKLLDKILPDMTPEQKTGFINNIEVLLQQGDTNQSARMSRVIDAPQTSPSPEDLEE